MKQHFFLLLSVCIGGLCVAQQKERYTGMLFTKVTTIGTSRDTLRLLVTKNGRGDRLCIFTIAGGLVATGTAYSIGTAKDGLYFYARPTIAGQLTADSLRIDFRDDAHTVLINNNDRYVLYPDYYTRLKQQLSAAHAVMPLLGLLADGIGDYPIENAFPIVLIDPPVDRRVESAVIVTKRTQSDLQDTWHCVYRYDKSNRLESIAASSDEVVGFTKKVQYEGGHISIVKTFLEKEERQQTDRTIHHDLRNRAVLKWQEDVVETGKNRETILSVTLTWRDIGMVQQLEPSAAAILKLLKTNKNGHAKKHIN